MISKDLYLHVKKNLVRPPQGPFCIDLVMSNFCNLRCRYCHGSVPPEPKTTLSKEVLIRILTCAQKMGVREISLTSLIGEPTVFNDIRFLMEEIKKHGFIGSLLTNGTLLDREFAVFLEKIAWDIIIISLDSFDESVQHALRPPAAGDGYGEKIKNFLRYSKDHIPGLNINLNMVVTNRNYQHVNDYFRQAQIYGVKNITLMKLSRMTESYEELKLSDAQEDEFRAELGKLDGSIHFNRLEWLPPERECPESLYAGRDNRSRKCYFHLYKVLIDCDGTVLKCNGDSERTPFNVYQENLDVIYGRLLERYASLREDPFCWGHCCSPIKAMNQELDRCLESNVY